MRLQQPDSARACFLDALEDAPALPEVRLNLGLLAWRVDPARAESLFRAELAWNPTCAKAWNNLGGLWLEQGEPARAAEAFRLALRLRPDLADAAWNLGLAQTRLGLAALAAGDSASARAVLQEVLSSPYRGAGQRRLATVLTSAGKPATP
jgi:tetratricopeptide (TPR) repeat protein